MYPTEIQHSLSLAFCTFTQKVTESESIERNINPKYHFLYTIKDRKLFDDRRTLKSAHRDDDNRSSSTHSSARHHATVRYVAGTERGLHDGIFMACFSLHYILTGVSIRKFTITKLLNVHAHTNKTHTPHKNHTHTHTTYTTQHTHTHTTYTTPHTNKPHTHITHTAHTPHTPHTHTHHTSQTPHTHHTHNTHHTAHTHTHHPHTHTTPHTRTTYTYHTHRTHTHHTRTTHTSHTHTPHTAHTSHITHTPHTTLWCCFWLSFLQSWTAHFVLVYLQFLLRYTVQNLLWLKRFLIQNTSVLILARMFCFQLNIKIFFFWFTLSVYTHTYLNFIKLSSIWYIVIQISRFAEYNPQEAMFHKFIYFCRTLYMFQTVFPSITRSSKLHIQRQALVRPMLLPATSLARLWQIPDAVCAVLSSWWWTENPCETCRASSSSSSS